MPGATARRRSCSPSALPRDGVVGDVWHVAASCDRFGDVRIERFALDVDGLHAFAREHRFEAFEGLLEAAAQAFAPPRTPARVRGCRAPARKRSSSARRCGARRSLELALDRASCSSRNRPSPEELVVVLVGARLSPRRAVRRALRRRARRRLRLRRRPLRSEGFRFIFKHCKDSSCVRRSVTTRDRGSPRSSVMPDRWSPYLASLNSASMTSSVGGRRAVLRSRAPFVPARRRCWSAASPFGRCRLVERSAIL